MERLSGASHLHETRFVWDHRGLTCRIGTTIASTAATARRGRLVRSRRERVLTGVAGGLGARIGVDPIILRIALIVLSLAGGAGIVLYGLAWLASDEPGEDEEPPARDLDLQQATAVGMIAIGVLLFLRSLGLWFADEIVWPALLLGVGSAVIWTRGGSELPHDPVGFGRGGALTIGRIVAGSALGIAGVLGLVTQLEEPLTAALTLGGALLGLGLLLGPWLYRLWLQLGEERSERARAQAREEVAAHLHDSVLQTLALIQRSSEQPRRMVALARRQERELRAWLYGSNEQLGATTLAAAVDELVGEFEARYPVDVEPVVVGDRPMDGDLDALLAATREALVNVGKHAGVDTASLYVEVEPHEVVVFVRDRGHGFDPTAVPDDRLGLANSVRSRLERHGGRASVHSTPGDGTEIELRQPLRRAARDAVAPVPPTEEEPR